MGNSESSSGVNPAPMAASAEAKDSAKIMVPESLLKKPREPRLILKSLSVDHWEKILPLLSTKDLLSLMLSCTETKEIVLNFVAHFVTSDNRMQRLEEVARLKTLPLLLQEKALVRKLAQLKKRESDRPTLIHFKAVRMFVESTDLLQREHVYDSDVAHLGNHNYVIKVFDDQLDRDIVRVNNVCWLHICKTFKSVRPGKYESSLRIRLARDIRWPNSTTDSQPAYIRASRLSTNDGKKVTTELSCQQVKPEWWRAIQRRQFDTRELAHATILHDSLGGSANWLWFILEPFVLEETADVQFEFKDVENPWWKHGMDFDFIQLKRLE